jgi:hypothetical protein
MDDNPFEPSGSIVIANVTFNSLRPLIILSNFVQILDVTCQDMEQTGDTDFPELIYPSLELVFDTPENAKLAFEEWSATKDLAIYVSHELECNRYKKAMLVMVSEWEIKGTNIKMMIYNLKWENVIKDYHVSVAKHREGKYRLDANYDTKTNSSINRDIRMYSSETSNVTCVDCYMVRLSNSAWRSVHEI